MSDRPPVLVLGNDLSPTAAKTSRDISLALERLGFRAICRDTRLIRWAVGEVENESSARREAYETGVVAKWRKFIFDYGFDMVIGPDLHWLFSAQLFVDEDQVKQIHSFWIDDIRSHLQGVSRFSFAPRTLLEIINNPKISHHCCYQGQAEELRLLGVERVIPSVTATRAEFLQASQTDPHFWEHRLKEALA